MSFAALMKRQRAWARSRQLTLEGVCLPSMDDNLFRPLHPETFRELTAGSGNELGIPGQRYRPKIRSIRSSSVFALNIFDYWRSRDLEPLAGALGVEGHFTSLQFERKAPHGLASEPPHLDVALTPDIRAPLLGIECKFAELYDRKNNKPGTVDAKYFGVMPGRWENLGLPRCQRLAEELGQSIDYHRLHAGQLLKHILGWRTLPTERDAKAASGSCTCGTTRKRLKRTRIASKSTISSSISTPRLNFVRSRFRSCFLDWRRSANPNTLNTCKRDTHSFAPDVSPRLAMWQIVYHSYQFSKTTRRTIRSCRRLWWSAAQDNIPKDTHPKTELVGRLCEPPRISWCVNERQRLPDI